MPSILHLVQNEKADLMQLKHNAYTLVQVSGEQKLNKTELAKFLTAEGFSVIKITSVNYPKKIRIRGGRNKVAKSRPRKFLATITKGQIIKPNEKNIV